ncbi:hypothetical protein JOB18_048962 [Solea senegalensis]|uniref:Uncharacterized protein n=1 Tax=Solea senegalensis TaxID=28829 RepID=A0AAV6SCM2_SOLSE|nr:hypothetical protein JOB18_048962 [Solea senegalensis]
MSPPHSGATLTVQRPRQRSQETSRAVPCRCVQPLLFDTELDPAASFHGAQSIV